METDSIGHFVLAFFMGGLMCSQFVDRLMESDVLHGQIVI